MNLLSILLYDLRQAWRSLLRSPGFLAVALLTLAIGIGANTAVFSLVNAVLIKGLPYREPDRLVHLWATGVDRVVHRHELSYLDYEDLKREQQSFSALTTYRGTGTLSFSSPGNSAEAVQAFMAGSDFLSVLGLTPTLGREFRPEDLEPGAAPGVLLNHGFWIRRLGGDPSWVGRTLLIGGQPRQVLGVLPADIQFPGADTSDIWTPLPLSEDERAHRGAYRLNVIGRLRKGVGLAQANAELDTFAARLAAAHPDSNTGARLDAIPLRDQLVGPLRPLLLGLLASVALVLLVACANLAALNLSRLSGRRQELAIRLALGAGRKQILRYLMVEGLSLAVVGGALGLLLGYLGLNALLASIPFDQRALIPALSHSKLDTGVFAFSLVLALLSGLLCSLGPALRSSGEDPNQVLKEEGRSGSGGRANRTRNLLVVGELALTTVLLLGAGLLIRSFTHMLNTDPGFNPRGLLTLRVRLEGPGAAERFQSTFAPELIRRVESLPGVDGATMVDVLPLSGGGNTGDCRVEGRPTPPPGQRPGGNVRTISESYFRVMQIPLLRGRTFTKEDAKDAPKAMVVNQAFADQAFPGEDPVGQGLIFDYINNPPTWRIVGVVGNERQTSMDGPITPVLYFLDQQDSPSSFMQLVVRSAKPEAIAPSVMKAAHEVEPSALAWSAVTMEQRVSASPSTFLRRFPAALLSLLSAVALGLAAIGIYGVMAYATGRRTREFGIRMALGADPGAILRLVLRQGLAIVALGSALGLVVSVPMNLLLRAQLFGVLPWDPWTYTSVILLLGSTALLACLLPALRAARVDPAIALRSE